MEKDYQAFKKREQSKTFDGSDDEAYEDSDEAYEEDEDDQ